VSTKRAVNEAAVIAFRDGAAVETWLDANVDRQAGVWLKLAKAGLGHSVADRRQYAVIHKLVTTRTAPAREVQLRRAVTARGSPGTRSR